MKDKKTQHSNLFKCSNTSMTSRIIQFSTKNDKKVETKIPINLKKKRDINSLMNIIGMLDGEDRTKEREISLQKAKLKNLKNTTLKDFSININNLKKGNLLDKFNKSYNARSSSSRAKTCENVCENKTSGNVMENELINNLCSSIKINISSSNNSNKLKPSTSHKSKATDLNSEHKLPNEQHHQHNFHPQQYSNNNIIYNPNLQFYNSNHKPTKSMDIQSFQCNSNEKSRQIIKSNNTTLSRSNERNTLKTKNLVDKTTGDNTMTISNKNKSDFHTIKLKDKGDKIEISGPEDLHLANVLKTQNNKIISRKFENINSLEDYDWDI